MPAESAQPRGAALFDQGERSGHRRRRPAPDWGGDDLFDHVPRRRFARPGDEATATRQPAGEVSAASALTRRVAAAPALTRPAPVQELVLARRAEYPQPRAPRPGRTVQQRIGARPERLAAWACALGVLLIVLAVVTAG